MYTMEYLLYRLRPFGVLSYRNELPKKIPWESIEQQHLTDLQRDNKRKPTNNNNNKTNQTHA